MSRRYEIPYAFRNSMVIEPSGRRILRTVDFVRELALINHHWSLKQANLWIEHYQHGFTDISTEEGENRTFFFYNPNSRGY